MSRTIIAAFIFFSPLILSAQNNKDTVVNIEGRLITLSEVVVNNKINVPAFIDRVRTDTTFYKAFRTLRIIGFTALNDIRMVYKDGDIKASLRSKIRQIRNNNCRSMEVLEETTTGDIYDNNKNFNYYTGEMYAGLLFTKGTICGEDNIVKRKGTVNCRIKRDGKTQGTIKDVILQPGETNKRAAFYQRQNSHF